MICKATSNKTLSTLLTLNNNCEINSNHKFKTALWGPHFRKLYARRFGDMQIKVMAVVKIAL